MKPKMPTGDNIFAEDNSLTMSEGRSVAHFAIRSAKGTGPRDAKARRKLTLKAVGTTDAKTRRKIKPTGTGDAKSRKKLNVPAKLAGPGDAKTRRKRFVIVKVPGPGDAKTKRTPHKHI